MSNDVRRHRKGKQVQPWDGASKMARHRAHGERFGIDVVVDNIKSILQKNKDGRPGKWH